MKNPDWTLRHRPQKLKGFAGDSELKAEMKDYIKNGGPHLLFVGEPGTGKTTLALIIAKAMTKEWFAYDFKEINASQNRGSSIVSSVIEPFLKTKGWGGRKVLLLDEADTIEPLTQKKLRRLMEQYAHNCQFILTGNDMDGFEKALVSRCRVIYFTGIKQKFILERLKQIAKKERLPITEKKLNGIVKKSFGDLRNAIQYLRVEKARSKA